MSAADQTYPAAALPSDPFLVLTREQVAGLLQVPIDSVSNLHRVGALRGVKIGKHLRWRLRDVRSYVEGLQP